MKASACIEPRPFARWFDSDWHSGRENRNKGAISLITTHLNSQYRYNFFRKDDGMYYLHLNFTGFVLWLEDSELEYSTRVFNQKVKAFLAQPQSLFKGIMQQEKLMRYW